MTTLMPLSNDTYRNCQRGHKKMSKTHNLALNIYFFVSQLFCFLSATLIYNINIVSSHQNP